jgi:hypothetical protein
MGITTIWSAVAAAGSLALARVGEDRERLVAGPETAGLGPTEGEVSALPGSSD